MLTPTAPASITRATKSPAACASAANPASTAAETGERSIAADHPMTRHDHRDRIGAVGKPDRTHRFRFADFLCQRAVAERFADRNPAQRFPDLVLEWRAGEDDRDFVQRVHVA